MVVFVRDSYRLTDIFLVGGEWLMPPDRLTRTVRSDKVEVEVTFWVLHTIMIDGFSF